MTRLSREGLRHQVRREARPAGRRRSETACRPDCWRARGGCICGRWRSRPSPGNPSRIFSDRPNIWDRGLPRCPMRRAPRAHDPDWRMQCRACRNRSRRPDASRCTRSSRRLPPRGGPAWSMCRRPPGGSMACAPFSGPLPGGPARHRSPARHPKGSPSSGGRARGRAAGP